MSVVEFIDFLSQQKNYILIFLLAITILSILMRYMHGKYRSNLTPWKQIYSVIVYLVCIPGMFSASIILYNLLFLHENLMDLDIYVCYLPIIFMIVTLSIIRNSVDFSNLPGVDKLSGLILIIGITFFSALILDRLRVFVVFGGSIFSLFIICIIVFILLKYALRLLFGKPKRKTGFSKHARNF